MKRRILILSVSAGAGHVRAAEALRQTAAREFGDAEALHLDVMDYASAAFRKLYADAYIKLVNKLPRVWGMLYQFTSSTPADATMNKVRRSIERLNTRALRKRIDEFAPDAIVCTHFLPAEILMHEIRRDRLDVPVWVQVTDFDLHRMWMIPHMTGFFAANDEIGFRMQRAGLGDAHVHVTGIPIVPAFADAHDRDACSRALGLDPSKRTILLMGGGAGVGHLDDIAQNLLQNGGDFQLIVLAGKNATALKTLQLMAQRYPTRLFPLGYTTEVEKVMACADLAISKPGGLTTSECLAMHVPMIVHSPIPGQEERNADYLMEQGAALKAVDPVGLSYRVQELLQSPERLVAMRRRCAALARPHAARDVLQIVLAHASALNA